MESLFEVWEEVLRYCSGQISSVAFDTWINILSLNDITAGQASLSVKTAFQRKTILENYNDLICDAFEHVLKFPVKIDIHTDAEAAAVVVSEDMNAQYDFTFDTFIVGSSNKFAHAAALAVAENPNVIYNPLFIYGNSGLGKTHLLRAIHKKIVEKYPLKKVISISSESFTNEFIQSLNNGNMAAFREKFRTADVFLIDDIQFIAGRESTQEEFFNTFNALTTSLYSEQKQIVVTSDRPPKDISSLDARIRSRFEQGLLADIQPPEFETRVGIIKRKAQTCQLSLNSDIIYYIAEQLKMNIRQLEGVVKKLHALSLISKDPLTIIDANNAIRDIRNDDQPEPVTVRKIIDEVSRIYNISYDDIISQKHNGPVSYARQVSMYIVREITQMPYAAIGAEFGKRDHSTVVYALKKIGNLKNAKEKGAINDIIKNLQNKNI